MSKIHSIDEILELAIEREIGSIQFYTEMAKRVKNPLLRKVIEQLAEEELEHKKKLELEVMKTGHVIKTNENPIEFNSDDYIEDSQTIADMDYKDLIIMALEKEKNSLRFYIELAIIIEDITSREILVSIAEQEAMHTARFETEYENLLSSEN